MTKIEIKNLTEEQKADLRAQLVADLQDQLAKEEEPLKFRKMNVGLGYELATCEEVDVDYNGEEVYVFNREMLGRLCHAYLESMTDTKTQHGFFFHNYLQEER